MTKNALIILAAAMIFPMMTMAETKDYEVRKDTVRYRSEKPKDGGPEARAILFLDLLIAGKLEEAKKEFFFKSISDEHAKLWDQFEEKHRTTYKLTKIRNWGVLKEMSGKPVVELIYYKEKGGKNIAVPMAKEGGKWMVCAYD